APAEPLRVGPDGELLGRAHPGPRLPLRSGQDRDRDDEPRPGHPGRRRRHGDADVGRRAPAPGALGPRLLRAIPRPDARPAGRGRAPPGHRSPEGGGEVSTRASPALVDRPMIKAHVAAGFGFFLVALFAGMFYALQLSRMYPFPGVELLSPGRLRMIH